MNDFIILILTGFIIGAFGTLVGAGGGFIIVPLLLFTHPDFSPAKVTAISMAVVALNAISGSVSYARSKRIDYKAGIVFALFTIPGSIAGVFAVKYIPPNLFNKIFGVLLSILSISLFLHNGKSRLINPKKRKNVAGLKHHRIIDKHKISFSYSYNQNYGIVISLFVGFLSPLLGIGGGIIHVPAMVSLLGFPVYIATATSHFILLIMSTVSVIVHIYYGSYNDHAVVMMVLALCIGVIPGAQFGAYFSHKIQTHIIVKTLAVCLGIVGIRLFFY